MEIQKRLLNFITKANWLLLVLSSIIGFVCFPFKVALGVFAGGLIVTLNFHLLGRTLKKALPPPHVSSHNVIIAKYYIRFIISGFIIFVLLSKRFVDPLGLLSGLSVVVVNICLATLLEITRNLFFKEAV